MNKKQYIFPLTEVAKVHMSGVILTSPIADPLPVPPPGPSGVSKHRTPVF